MSRQKLFKIIVIAIFLALTTGCSLKAPSYSTNFETVNNLKEAGLLQAKVDIESKANAIQKFQIRGGVFFSPYGNNFDNYVESIIENTLKQAGLLDVKSDIKIYCNLITLDVDTSSFSTGVTNISGNFKVTKNNTVIFSKTISVQEIFNSHFVGAIAVENGANSFAKSSVKLVDKFLNDKDFMNSLTKDKK